jgi:hypothetical protein
MKARALVPLCGAMMLLAVPATAVPNACGEAYVGAQRLRSEGKPLGARDMLVTCVKVCSGAFRDECDGWLAEMSPRVPSIVVRAQDPDGNDVVDVTVDVDGKRVAGQLDGKPIDLEVGKHKVVLTHAGSKPLEREVVATDGGVRRLLLVRFERPGGTPAPAPTPPAPRRTTWIPFLAGGGILLAAGAVFGILAAGQKNASQCPNGCFRTTPTGALNTDVTSAEDAYHRANTFAWVSNVGVGAGLVAVAIGTYFLVASKPTPAASATR